MSTQLCLYAGSLVLPDGTSAPVQVPAGTKAYLLLFGRTPTTTGPGAGTLTASTVDVFTSTSSPWSAAGADCTLACSPTALAASDLAAGTSPGSTAGTFWHFLGTFDLPASGVVATDAATVVGLCGSAFATTGTCATRTTVTPGATGVQSQLTVVAGTSAAPEDIWLGGPLASYSGGALSLVATGHIVVPYWSHTEEGALSVDASLTSLGLSVPGDPPGTAQQPALVTSPQVLHPQNGATDPDYAKAITITGALLGQSFDFSLPGYTSLTLQVEPVQSPWYGQFYDNFQAVSAVPMTPAQMAAMP